MSEVVLRVSDVAKTFRVGLWRKKVEAVRGVSFEVQRGEIFGLLGPNGAGKTTTIKMVLGLIFPQRGAIELFGARGRSPKTAVRLGYLPENPYVYQYLRPLEFLDLCGRLTDLSRAERSKRAHAMLERVGLAGAADRPIGKFSKGMMQRIGLAQALLHEPELLILDEPMSGLDPIGRKDVRDLILEERKRGTTILFTSHILSDVELLCDRVGIVQRGRMSHYGVLRELLEREQSVHLARTEIESADASDELRARLSGAITERAGHLLLTVESQQATQEALRTAIDGGARIVAVTPGRGRLEDLFERSGADP